MRSGGGGVAIGRGPSTTSTSPPTGSSELERQHVDRVGLAQAEVDLVRREQPPRLRGVTELHRQLPTAAPRNRVEQELGPDAELRNGQDRQHNVQLRHDANGELAGKGDFGADDPACSAMSSNGMGSTDEGPGS